MLPLQEVAFLVWFPVSYSISEIVEDTVSSKFFTDKNIFLLLQMNWTSCWLSYSPSFLEILAHDLLLAALCSLLATSVSFPVDHDSQVVVKHLG